MEERLLWREKQWQRRENEILEAAISLFGERGYYKVTVDDIAARVGVGKGTVYRHFGDKKGLFEAALHRGIQMATDEVKKKIESIDDPVECLRETTELMIELSKQYFSLLRTVKEQLPQFKKDKDASRGLAPLIAGVIERGKAQGRMRDVNSTVAAHALLGLIETVFSPIVGLGTGLSPEEAIRTIEEIFLSGLLVTEPPSK
ncbi:MAG: TetR/AcrR family transcriptional regulator [Actinobacteria bacterium]|nr:TetR/AcrR family transcriptional regulator [Actinomycetota bacterium]